MSVSFCRVNVNFMRNLPELESTFAKLISLSSISSLDTTKDQSNLAVVEALSDYLEALNFDIDIMQIGEKPDKFNLLARRGEGNDGLVLSGHTDTVPYDEKGWLTDPFLLTKKNEFYYGLGTSDMKGFFSIVIETLVRSFDINYKKPIIVLATADEESTMLGARCIKEKYKQLGKYCVIGEPTALKPIYMHKGVIVETITIEGKSGHSSDPSLGNSALEGMNDVINALRLWRDELQKKYVNNEFSLPFSTLNFGKISGGDSVNRICAKCKLSLDFRLLPEMELELVRKTLREKVREALVGTGLQIRFNDSFSGLLPMKTSRDSNIIKYSEEYTGQCSGAVAFGTEGSFYNQMGMDTVILGPGDIEVAHKPNEYLQIGRIEPMIGILSKLLYRVCGRK